MYQKLFGLTHRPFSATPDPHILYNSHAVRHCLGTLEQTLRQGEGLGLLTSAAGTGKTLVCKVLAERLANDPLPVLLLNSSYATRSSLLQAILFELGQSYVRMTEQELRLELVSYGRKIAESQTGIALIVDEAHLLGEHILEELRALTNFMYQSRPIFRVVLSGQNSLEEMLTRRSLEAVNQRLHCHVTLSPLTQQESLEYIISRVEYAGGELLKIFSETALKLIIHAADGLPRCLNQLCDHACLLASVEGVRPVQPTHVREALSDLQKLPLHWNVPLPTTDPLTEMHFPDPTKNTASEPAASSQAFEVGQGEVGQIEVGQHAAYPHHDSPYLPPEQSATAPAESAAIEIGSFPDIGAAFTSVIEIGGELPAENTEPSSPVPHAEITSEATIERETAQRETAKQETVKTVKQEAVEVIQDAYARLDARRKGQLDLDDCNPAPQLASSPQSASTAPPASTPRPVKAQPEFPLSGDEELEYQLGQTVLEISADITAALSGSGMDHDLPPTPEQLLQQPQDSRSAYDDIVLPEEETADYNRLYSELRRRRETGDSF